MLTLYITIGSFIGLLTVCYMIRKETNKMDFEEAMLYLEGGIKDFKPSKGRYQYLKGEFNLIETFKYKERERIQKAWSEFQFKYREFSEYAV